jgi:hypothetical protein
MPLSVGVETVSEEGVEKKKEKKKRREKKKE